MCKLAIEEIAAAIKCEIVTWQEKQIVRGFTSNHKAPFSQSLVFLFKKQSDEDGLLERLIKAKSTGVVVGRKHSLHIERFAQAGIGVLRVDHVLQAYYLMARLYRQQFNIPFVQVTGSSGKTTTKELIGKVLKQEYQCLVGEANFNAPEGVAYNISRLKVKHQVAILEAGISSFDTMGISSSMIQPKIGVVTCIHRAHLSSLGTIENIIKAKADMVQYLSPNGSLIINGDDPNCIEYLKIARYSGKVITFGLSETNTIHAKNIRYQDFQSIFTVKGKEFEFDCMINTIGSYNVTNALAAIAVGVELQVPLEKIRQGLSMFSPVEGRLEIISGSNDITIVHDNFNANPDSTSQLLNQVPFFPKRPIILVLGDMERPSADESYAKKVHFQIGQQAGGLFIDKLIAIGKWAEEYCKGAKSMGIKENKLYFYKKVEEAKQELPQLVAPNSILLFKASVAHCNLKPLINIYLHK